MRDFRQERREARAQRVAAVKALNLQPGEWVAKGTKKNSIFRAYPSLLDARTVDFQWLRRATPEEIEERETNDRKREQARLAVEQRRNQRDYVLASRFASTDTETWLKFPIERLEQIAYILDREMGR